MSKQGARPAKPQNDQMLSYVQPKTQQQDDSFPSQPQRSWDGLASNVSTATFSSMSKQAESLVNGGNNVVFNPYNNNLVFQWVSMSMNDCLSIDLINRALLNLMSLKFVAGGEIRGITDGFTVDEKGQIVQLYDPTNYYYARLHYVLRTSCLPSLCAVIACSACVSALSCGLAPPLLRSLFF